MLSLLLLGLTATFWTLGYTLTGQNTPPVFDFKRDWIIKENEEVGNRITTARTRDQEGDTIVYGIEPAFSHDGSNYFRIDKATGEVYLAQSLVGKSGEDFYLYITANDSHQVAKIEVYVRVVEPNVRPQEPTIEVPFSTSHPARIQPFPVRPRPDDPFVPSPPDSPSSSHPRPQKVVPPRKHPNAQPPATPPPAVAVSSEGSVPTVRVLPPGESGPENGDKTEHGVDMTSTILPITTVTGLAPLLMLFIWIVHKRCKKMDKLTTDKDQGRGNSQLAHTVSFSFHPNGLYQPRPFRQDPPLFASDEVARISDDRKWEFPRHHLHFLGILGEGCFGQVWKCEATNLGPREGTSIVAVKTLKENATEKEKADLLSELEVMKLLDPHPNVVTLLGCCSERDPIFVILEYIPGGKLQTYLRESRAQRSYGNLHGSSTHLTSRDLTSFGYQVAKGMEYLACKGIIHRDLAARNVLIDNKACKVADFGFARDVISSHVYEKKSEGRLPIRWMAPESLYDNIYTTKTDVWSFGILLWEIVTLGSTPYPGMSAREVMWRVKEGHRLEKPEHCKREVYNIMFYCWDQDPAERPCFSELVSLLDQLLISEHDYIELDNFPDHYYYNLTNMSGEKL